MNDTTTYQNRQQRRTEKAKTRATNRAKARAWQQKNTKARRRLAVPEFEVSRGHSRDVSWFNGRRSYNGPHKRRRVGRGGKRQNWGT